MPECFFVWYLVIGYWVIENWFPTIVQLNNIFLIFPE